MKGMVDLGMNNVVGLTICAVDFPGIVTAIERSA